MSIAFHVIIPARYQSTRMPGKLLMDLKGQSVLERVYRQALKARPQSVTIATDSELIFNQCRAFGAPVVMTSMAHQSGTDRIAEVVAKPPFLPDDLIVNVQGDEPLIAPELIRQVARSLSSSNASMATLCWPMAATEAHNPNVVKVVRDCHHQALYFSRQAIPYDQNKTSEILFRHIGLYAYRTQFLLEFVIWPVCALEASESLEQLRVLWAGHKIQVDEACVPPLQDINTEEDLALARLSCFS